MARIHDRDLELARQLPDDFVVAGHGSAAYRLIEIVRENWAKHEIKARLELVDALLPVLEPLLEVGARVTEEKRLLCKVIVAKWMERQ